MILTENLENTVFRRGSFDFDIMVHGVKFFIISDPHESLYPHRQNLKRKCLPSAGGASVLCL